MAGLGPAFSGQMVTSSHHASYHHTTRVVINTLQGALAWRLACAVVTKRWQEVYHQKAGKLGLEYDTAPGNTAC